MGWALVMPKANKPASHGRAGSGPSRTELALALASWVATSQVSKPFWACLALRKRGSCFGWVLASFLVLGSKPFPFEGNETSTFSGLPENTGEDTGEKAQQRRLPDTQEERHRGST